MEVDSSTRLCCLIGHPVKHSVSPQMHNAAFKELGLNCIYLVFDVLEESLGEAVNGLRSIGVLGFNVTIPHKIKIIKFLDELDDSAKLVKAVNTVIRRDAKLIGYNTDLYGIERVLREVDELNRDLGLIIGAGGAGRASAIALTNLGFSEIIIANRTFERASNLAEQIHELGFSAKPIPLTDLPRYASSANLIINATPLGMAPSLISETPLKRDHIRRNSIVLDLVYNPLRTRLLIEAERAGACTISGLKVLVAQGAEAFKLWTGIDPPIDVMYSAALKALRGEKI